MAAVMVHKGHTVVGVDVNADYVAAIQEGRPPVNEPRLAEMITANRERLSATGDYADAMLATDATFIIVPTPSESDGRFSMKYVLKRGRTDRRGASTRRAGIWWCFRAP